MATETFKVMALLCIDMREFATYDVVLVYNTDDGIEEFTELEGVSKSRAERKVERLEEDPTCTPLDIKAERRT